MSLLENHLEQIQLCASTIEQLPFPPSKIFTNAMLNTGDITSLIRDTEAHERALFSLAPSEDHSHRRRTVAPAKRRATTLPSQQEEVGLQPTFRAPRKGTAVASVLGGDLSEKIRREYQRDTREYSKDRRQQRDDFDVELLLTGAQRFPIPGALERIAALRHRNAKVSDSLDHYENLVEEQSIQLGRMNGLSSASLDDEADEEVVTNNRTSMSAIETPMTAEDLRKEEEGIAELERKKRTLEERVNGIEKDLGGLMR
ncbi:MAG: hypothetical protein Q9162_005227 [Coniocarpon cinnabarinum]